MRVAIEIAKDQVLFLRQWIATDHPQLTLSDAVWLCYNQGYEIYHEQHTKESQREGGQ